MKNGFFRVAAASPVVTIADPADNVRHIIALANQLSAEDVELAVFPEMSVTGYTCADLFHNSRLLKAAEDAVVQLLELSADLPMTIVVGAPVFSQNALYNCALFINKGVIYGIVPKTYLPSYNEFYEKRWWQAAPDDMRLVDYAGCKGVSFGTRQLFDINGVKVTAEICEDLWTPVPPSCMSTMAGAEVIVNLSASDALIGKYAYLEGLVKQQSARCLCGYVYAGAGWGESSTDLVFDGIALVSECGNMLSEGGRWHTDNTVAIADIDIMAIRRDRMHNNSFNDCARNNFATGYAVNVIENALVVDNDFDLKRYVDPDPFVPADSNHLDERCNEIINIQTTGLMRRLAFTHCRNLVVGISGGLDSTLALLVAVRAFDNLQLDRKGIVGVTMPGFGTTDRTHDNAVDLMQKLGISTREISIVPAVEQHFKDIEHDPANHDITYENAQARQRTYLLMDIANQVGGMVLGTGDLSELALGWATYNGDHMSMYGVNAGVPKTLVRHLVRWFATWDKSLKEILLDIADTPISPELLPADKDGNIAQKTEDSVGPYRLHDFFLYYTLRYGFGTDRIELLARKAFDGVYDNETINHWLTTFTRRFFAQQFKRSCLPDGPKVGSVCLSPRGDWRMPSDAPSTAWLK